MKLLAGFLTLALILGLTTSPAAASTAHSAARHPHTYVVSRVPGTTVEGITVTSDGTMFVTSIGTGAVYRGTVTDPRLRPWIPAGADGRSSAAGVHVDHYGRVFVAGFDTGVLYVYGRDGHLVAARPTRDGAALNDFVITRDAVYVTDSNLGTVWRAPIHGRHIGDLTPWLTPDRFSPAPGYLNGIVATPDGRYLLLADQDTNLTYRVDIARRTASAISVSGADGLFSADGMLLYGHDLYGVYNYGATVETLRFVVRHVRLSNDWTAATWVADSDSVGADRAPSTIARDGCRLLWVNSQLFFAPGTPPYTVSEVPGLTVSGW